MNNDLTRPKRRAASGAFVRQILDRARQGRRTAIARVSTSNERMLTQAESKRAGTRKRALLPVVAGFLALFGMFAAVSANVLAVNFTTGNNKFRLYSNYMDAQSAAGFLAPSDRQAGGNTGVVELGIKSARLSGLCVLAKDDILGGIALRVTAGDPVPAAAYSATTPPSPAGLYRTTDQDGPDAGSVVGDSPDEKAGSLTGAGLSDAISATNLYINSDNLTGYGNLISGLNLGQAAGGVNGVEALAGVNIDETPADPGNFGLYAQQLNVAGLSGDTYGLNLAGAITLPKLKISVINKLWGGNSLNSLSQADCS